LSYACSLISNKATKEGISILLLHVYTIPANYSGDGIALITINNALDNAEEDLHEELEWAHEEYPHLTVIGKVTTGRLLDGLRDEIDEMQASLVILGTGGHYGDLWSWDSNILNVLRGLPVPVLTIPPDVTFKPLQNVAFACNLKNINDRTPFGTLTNLAAFTEAKLHVVYVINHELKPGSIEAENKLLVHDKLKDLDPAYHTLYENEVVEAIGSFVKENQIQLLLVMPKKHGVWESLFHKSFTKELARLNQLPIMALH
jgi:nucleotide-binding universal stress UspA family protein